jgi:hypothetical protein
MSFFINLVPSGEELNPASLFIYSGDLCSAIPLGLPSKFIDKITHLRIIFLQIIRP